MSDYEHHAPRVINKTKKQRDFVNEETLENRKNRVNFKSYLRSLEEQELLDEDSQEEWFIQKIIPHQYGQPLVEDITMTYYVSEEEADWEAYKLQQLEAEDSNITYRSAKA